MIKFVDLDNGNIYDGQPPYIHWFGDQQSVQLFYAKKICMVSEYETVVVSMNDNSVFSLLDLQKVDDDETEIINNFEYHNLEHLIVGSDSQGVHQYTSTGFHYQQDNQNVYLHMIYVVSKSDNEGEFVENIKLTCKDGTKSLKPIYIKVGTQIYAEYEPHKINLANMGVAIPETVHKAIYESNVHEDLNDYALLNRKRKEILIDYWNLIASRGSAKSLSDAISWLDYSDLVEVRELWAHDVYGKQFYDREFVTSTLSEHIKQTLSEYTKTTYIGLYFAMQQCAKNKKGGMTYETVVMDGGTAAAGEFVTSPAELSEPLPHDDDSDYSRMFEIGSDGVDISDAEGGYPGTGPIDSGSYWVKNKFENYRGPLSEMNPQLADVATAWSADDLSLKMYLLGNFQELFFAPIHIQLLHSTIESLVYADASVKIINRGHWHRADRYNSFKTLDCSLEDGGIYYMDEVHTQVGPSTNTGSQYATVYNDYKQSYKYIISGTTGQEILDMTKYYKEYSMPHYFTLQKNVDDYYKEWTNSEGRTDRDKLWDKYIAASTSYNEFVEEGITGYENDKPVYAQYAYKECKEAYETYSYRYTYDDDTQTHNLVIHYDDMKDNMLGIDEFNVSIPLSGGTFIEDNNLKTFLTQYNNGLGCVIPIHCEFDDEMQRMELAITFEDNVTKETKRVYRKFDIHIIDNQYDFNLICLKSGYYGLTINFTSIGGESYIVTKNFTIVDNSVRELCAYKIVSNVSELSSNKFMFKHDRNRYENVETLMKEDPSKFMYTQFLPAKKDSKNGVKWNRILTYSGDIIKVVKKYAYPNIDNLLPHTVTNYTYEDENGNKVTKDITITHDGVYNYIDMVVKYGEDSKDQTFYNSKIQREAYYEKLVGRVEEEYEHILWCILLYCDMSYKYKINYNPYYIDYQTITYTSIIDKMFTSDENAEYNVVMDSIKRVLSYIPELSIVKDSYIYFPNKHYLVPIEGNTLEDFTIYDDDSVCIIPNIQFTEYIEDPEWVFTNISTGKQVSLPSVKEPFVARTEYELPEDAGLPKGYYNILFKYRIGDVTQSVSLNSAFRKL